MDLRSGPFPAGPPEGAERRRLRGREETLLRARAEHELSGSRLERMLTRHQQQMVDAEVRATQRLLLNHVRARLRGGLSALTAENFLKVADRSTVTEAIALAGCMVGGADACDVQVYDPATGALTMAGHRGFPAAFIDYFARVDTGCPTTCALALATREPVIVQDVTTSPIFAGRPTLPVLLEAGSRAVRSYPLHSPDDDRLLGMVSFHHRVPKPHCRLADDVVRAAASALTQVMPD